MITGAATDVVSRLEALLGAEFVTTAGTSGRAVEGTIPAAVVRPADAGQVAAVLRVCAEAGAAVVPWGGGTAIEIGNPPRAADVVLLTDRLSRLVDHDHSNLTVTVEAGITLGALGAALAAHHQFLPLEPPRAESATAGGAIAVNLNGPRRMRYGSARDFVIGMRAALADGRVIKAGGKTVKNVAGYDMGRLFVGSLGTLGVLTDLTFKVSPLPEASKTVVVQAAETRVLGALAGQVFSSPLTPSAVTIVNRAAAQRLGRDAAALLVRAEGVEPAVARHERDITGWAGRSGLQAEVLAGEAEIGLWRQVRDFGWTGERAAVRLSVPPGKVGTLLQDLDVMLPASSGVVADAGTGTVWIGLHGGDPVLTLVAHLRGLTERDDGTLLLARASRDLKAEGDVWAPPPSPRLLETMWSLKLSFDPHQILNPGRFVAGL